MQSKSHNLTDYPYKLNTIFAAALVVSGFQILKHKLLSIYALLYNVLFLYAILVLTPSVMVKITSNMDQNVGRNLTLQCTVTTVRGITSGVDVVWHRDGTEVQRMDNVTLELNRMSTSLVYRDTYTIPLLTTSDEGSIFQCEVMIISSPPVMASSSLSRLRVKGMYVCNKYICI